MFFVILLLLLFLANILMIKMVCIWPKKKVKERDLLYITVAGLLPFEYTNIYDFVNQISTTKISFKCDQVRPHTHTSVEWKQIINFISKSKYMAICRKKNFTCAIPCFFFWLITK